MKLRAPARLAEGQACLGFPCVSAPCPEVALKEAVGEGVVGQGPEPHAPSLCLCISLLSGPESQQPRAAAVLFNPFVIKSD